MTPELDALGFSSFFARQLADDEMEPERLVRVTAVHRSGIVVSDGEHERQIALSGNWLRKPAEERPTVGDWVVLNTSCSAFSRILERKSLFKRVAAGTRVEIQPIASNIDTLFIVLSCNDDFNESRLERYLAMAMEADVFPIVVLTKDDLTGEGEAFRQRALAVRPDVPVELVNALDADSLAGVSAWVSRGTTVALVGSSGVGKSTIVNTLSGKTVMQTAGIREKDAKGRHTTTFRALHRLESGGILLDVPGLRELKVADIGESLPGLFGDIVALAAGCRFSDCAHDSEPGCAVRRAIDDGELDVRRLANYRKLQQENAFHNATLAERRNRGRELGRIVKEAVALKRKNHDG